MSFSKLASSIVHSSLWTYEDHIRLLFVSLLAICDYEGFVYGSRHGLERAANIRWNRETQRDPWDALTSPDPDSSDLLRNPENEGRRIEAVPGGFRILNYLYYRSLRNDDDRREQNRRSQKKFRVKSTTKRASAKVSHSKPKSATVSPDKPEYAHPDADADADAVLLSSKESSTKNDAPHRALCAPDQRRVDELMEELRAILPKREMDQLAVLWAKRIRHCSKAVAFAIEDYKVRTPDQRRKIRNVGAWLTDRHARALVEVLGK